MRSFMLFGILAVLLQSGVADAADPLPAPKGPVLLVVSGRIEQTNAPGQARFDREMLEVLDKGSFTTGSAVSNKPQLFEGVPLRVVLDRVGAKGRAMHASAHNGYEIDIPWDDLQYEPLLSMRVDGQLLTLRDKGPLWIVYPRDAHKELDAQIYDSRWVWQLKELRVE